MSSEVRITMTRLDEFASRLQKVKIPDIVLEARKDIAALIANDARPKVPVITGNARGSIVVTESGKGVDVRGGVGVPYFGWLDFGGSVGPNKSIHRPYLTTGRYIWRSFADHRTEIMERMEQAIAAGFRKEGINVEP